MQRIVVIALLILSVFASNFVPQYQPKKLKILAHAIGAPGHFNAINTIVKQLVENGHEVTLITQKGAQIFSDLSHVTKVVFVNESRMFFKHDELVKSQDKMRRYMIEMQKLSPLDSIITTLKHVSIPFEEEAALEFQKLLKTEKFDLLLMDSMSFFIRPLAVELGIPCVVNNPSFPLSEDSNYPAYGSGFGLEALQSYPERLYLPFHNSKFRLNVLYLFFKSYQKYVPEKKWKMMKYLIAANYKCVTLNTVPLGFDYATNDVNPLRYYVGPLFQTTNFHQKQEALSKSKLGKWLDMRYEEGKSVVYSAFGTSGSIKTWFFTSLLYGLKNVTTVLPNVRFLIALADHNYEEFENWKQTIPWSERKVFESDLFYFEKGYVPQTAILSHKAIAAFISHCGMNSVLEGLSFGKPIIASPFTYDQFDVAARIVDSKSGLSLMDHRDLPKFYDDIPFIFTPQKVYLAVKEVLTNEEYKKGAERIRAIIHYSGGVKAAAEIIEQIAILGTDHLFPWNSFPWYKRMRLDIYLIYGSVLIFFYVLYKATKYFLFRKTKPTKLHID